MNQVSRGEKLLHLLETKGALTPGGLAFLQVSLDPFHDSPIIGCVGYPDDETSPSVVRCVKRSVNITRPVGFIGTEWSFQVNAFPFHNEIQMNLRSRKNNVIDGAETGSVTHGGVEVTCLDTGSPDVTSGSYFNLSVAPNYRCSLGKNYSKGLARVIGIGYEVSDNTAEIYKQGHSYHSRVSSQKLESTTYSYMNENLPSWGALHATCTHYRNIMPDPQTMMIQPGTVDWPAREGTYVVCSFADKNFPTYVDYVMPIYTESALNPAVDDEEETGNILAGPNNTAPLHVPTVYWNGVASKTPPQLPAVRLSNIDASSSMFTGLNNVASMTLTVHYFVESFPSVAEPDILVLATASAPSDHLALELYSAAVQHLPVAVRVGMNPSGEWWGDVIEKATAAIAPAIGILPGFGPMAEAGVKGLGGMLANYMRTPDEKPARKRQPQKRAQNQNRQMLAPGPRVIQARSGGPAPSARNRRRRGNPPPPRKGQNNPPPRRR